MVSGGKDAFAKSFMRSGLLFRAIVAQSRHQFDQTRRQMDRLPFQAGPELLTNFLANCRAMHAVDVIALLLRWIGHDQRRAVTRRASRIFVVPSAVRKQDAAMWGQTCVAQVICGSANCRRSPLASAANSLASTFGAKTGKAITAEPRSRTTARAEKDLNIWEADFGWPQPHRARGSRHQQLKRELVPFRQFYPPIWPGPLWDAAAAVSR
jgi:hypothetical protein